MIGYFSSTIQNFERSNISRCLFSPDVKALHSLEGCHSEIDKIPDIESDIMTLRVCVTLLSGLGSLEAFFGLMKSVRSKQFFFSGL